MQTAKYYGTASHLLQHPVILLWELRHQTGAAYSVALKTIAREDVRMVGVLEPHDEPEGQHVLFVL